MPSSAAEEVTTAASNSSDTTPPVTKKQKTSGTSVKTVKAIDPAVIIQRRDVVNKRILALESKLAKDRLLLAKYTIDSEPGKLQQQQPIDNDNGNESSSSDK
jgi:hypothetical protein